MRFPWIPWDLSIIIIIIIIIPSISRILSDFEKILIEKLIKVATTPDSHREQRNRGATRYWICEPRHKNIEIKKNSSPLVARLLADLFAKRLKKWQADALMGPRVSTAIGWKWRSAAGAVYLFIFLNAACSAIYWSWLSGSWGYKWGQTTQTIDLR